MKEYIKSYLKLINYSLLGVIFMLSGFYMIINFYHYLEVRKDYTLNVKEDALYLKTEEKIKNIKDSTNVDLNKYAGNFSFFEISAFKNKLSECEKALNNEAFIDLKNKTSISIKDVYKINEQLDNDIIGKCVVGNFGFLGRLDNNESRPDDLTVAIKKYTDFPKSTAYINMLVNNIMASNNYMKKDMLNNSSYFFNTTIVNNTMRSNTRDSYGELINTYYKSASFIEELANWFKEETKGAR